MIEVRFFSTLRNGREKITQVPSEDAACAGDLLRKFEISAEDVAILLINGFHARPEDPVKDGDVISLFPPVGGG